MKKPLTFSIEQRKEIIRRYINGESPEMMCKDFNVSLTPIRRVLKEEGVYKQKLVGQTIGYSHDFIVETIKNSYGFRNASQQLNCDPSTVVSYVKLHKIDISHWPPRHIRNSIGSSASAKKLTSDEIFKNDSYYNTFIRSKYAAMFPEKCSECGICEWRGNPLPIQLDHIDGNKRNNTLCNLRWLCPNCHAQTPTFNRGLRKRVKLEIPIEELLEMHKTYSKSQICKILKISMYNLTKILKESK